MGGAGDQRGVPSAPLRVAFDATLLGARFSGVERAVAHTLAALAATAPPQARLAAYVGERFDAYEAEFHPGGLDPTGRLALRRVPLDNANRLARLAWSQLSLARLARAAGDDLLHSPAYLCPLAGGLPRVLGLFDLIALDNPDLATRANRLNYGLWLPHCVRRAEAVVVPSEAVAEAVTRRWPAAAARLTVVPLGVEPRFAAAGEADVARVVERFRLPKRYVLWVGNVEPKKNVAVLLRAWSRAAELGLDLPQLVLAGALSWSSEGLCDDWLARGLQQQVRLLGRVADGDLPALYAGATAFAFPSLAEGFGLPPLEAMAAGVPVIAARIGALSEVVGEAGLLVPPDDADGWATALARVCDEPALAERLADAGRARAAEYSWERTARATWAVYAQVLGRKDEGMARKGKQGDDERMWAGGTADFDERTGRYKPARALIERIERWIKATGRNEFGDPPDTVYAGGNPLFDMRTGETRDRHDYILERHPEVREWEED